MFYPNSNGIKAIKHKVHYLAFNLTQHFGINDIYTYIYIFIFFPTFELKKNFFFFF